LLHTQEVAGSKPAAPTEARITDPIAGGGPCRCGSLLAGSFFCSVHPSGILAFDVQPRGPDLRLTALPTVLIGIPLGLGLLALVGALRRLSAAQPRVADRAPGTG
jgi:hypothetical protein